MCGAVPVGMSTASVWPKPSLWRANILARLFSSVSLSWGQVPPFRTSAGTLSTGTAASGVALVPPTSMVPFSVEGDVLFPYDLLWIEWMVAKGLEGAQQDMG